MGFEEEVYRHLKGVNAAINEFLDSKITHAITPYHAEYYSNIKEFIMRGGKRLRPVSLVNAYFGVGGKNKGDVYKASISVELLHNATLIHDDLIDHDETRRGKETFHVKYRNWYNENFEGERGEDFGMTMAILGGNTVYNLGVEALLEAGFSSDLTCKAISKYQRVFEELIEGVMFETVLSMREKASFSEYMQMIKMKTAALLESSVEIGAILGGGSEKQVQALKEYAILVGQAFQIQDDILGTFGEEEETGKPTDGDIKEGKKTALVVYALEAAGPEELSVLRSVLGKRNATPSEVEEVRRVFMNTGALERARETAIKLKSEAKEKIRSMKPSLTKEAEEYFLGLADFVVERIR
ncbi:MAG: polyprenyl synthetase family protein [Candidatus Jordarchaeales archaeon]|nr:polyprenyl synthetase family protein [Candidatus Jordarchaeia archaeon]